MSFIGGVAVSAGVDINMCILNATIATVRLKKSRCFRISFFISFINLWVSFFSFVFFAGLSTETHSIHVQSTFSPSKRIERSMKNSTIVSFRKPSIWKTNKGISLLFCVYLSEWVFECVFQSDISSSKLKCSRSLFYSILIPINGNVHFRNAVHGKKLQTPFTAHWMHSFLRFEFSFSGLPQSEM